MRAVKQRDKSIDILRFIALTGIICIHVLPTPIQGVGQSFISQLRSFDVPMMVFLSGVSYSLSSNKPLTYGHYVVKRFYRLIFPTWIFLCLYYSLHLLYAPVPLLQIFYFGVFYTSWYVWIIRVFFVIALFAPFILNITSKIKLRHYFLLAFLFLVINETLAIMDHDRNPDNISVMIIMNIAYLIVFSLGTIIKKMTRTQCKLIACLFFIVYFVICTYLFESNGEFVLTQVHKYPPRIYYLAYALSAIMLLWLIRNKITLVLTKLGLQDICAFIGSHTIWIYFWHILLVEYANDTIASAMFRFLFTYGIAIIITMIQHYFLEKIEMQISHDYTRKMLRMIFNG